MLCFELELERPNTKRAITNALTMGFSYFAGGLIMLTLYMSISNENAALILDYFTFVALLIFGYIKGRRTGWHPFRRALQTTRIVDLAATTAFDLAGLISK